MKDEKDMQDIERRNQEGAAEAGEQEEGGEHEGEQGEGGGNEAPVQEKNQEFVYDDEEIEGAGEEQGEESPTAARNSVRREQWRTHGSTGEPTDPLTPPGLLTPRYQQRRAPKPAEQQPPFGADGQYNGQEQDLATDEAIAEILAQQERERVARGPVRGKGKGKGGKGKKSY